LFKKICQENHDLCKLKHQDYGPENVQFLGLEGLTYRMMEKVLRLRRIIKQGGPRVREETVVKELKDIANIAIIGEMLELGGWY